VIEWNVDGGIHEIPLPDPIAGRLWLCGKHAIGPDPEALMATVGADMVVCLNEEYELRDRYPGYVAWLRGQPGERAVWFPIPDLHAPPLERYRPLLDDLRARLAAGRKIVVHCGAGVGRAGTTAVALLVGFGIPMDEALAHVRAHRPMAGPEAGAQFDVVRQLHDTRGD
jgi:protein-tyrosine phosphatase